MTASPKEDYSRVMLRSLSEVRRALFATGLILFLGLAVYVYIPELRVISQTQELAYQRSHRYEPWGAQVKYQALTADEEYSNQKLAEDLHILARRFKRGNFNVLRLPGIRATEIYQKVAQYRLAYRYDVQTQDKGAVLNIRSVNSRAVRALHAYLRYLERGSHKGP